MLSPLGRRREGMAAIVDQQQLLDRQVRVALRGGQTLMAQELLNDAEVRPSFEHVGRTHVPQGVRMQVSSPGSEGSIAVDEILNLPYSESPAVAPQ